MSVLFGRNTENIYYSHMNPAGVWDIQNERISGTLGPKDIAIQVSTQGVVMAAWVGNSGNRGDIFTSIRGANGSWSTPQNISGAASPAGSAHGPQIAKAPDGGLRAVWSMIKTDPLIDPGYDDLYYREYVPGTGWNGQPVVRMTNTSGNDYNPAIAVDSSGLSHIVWGSDTVNLRGFFRLQYAVGRGTAFTFTPDFIAASLPGAFQKEPAMDSSPSTPLAPGAVHVVFGSNYTGSQKDNFYTYALTTPPPPTNTPTPFASPTPCSAGAYSDVFPTDYYYVPARELGIAGVMSGYSDCTFRPTNNITRGQAAKIMVLGANRPINTQGGPHFTDVPATNTFYPFIETAYNAGIISGYSDNTFRANANVTRGQFSKMVILAFRFTVNTQGGPHFTDVPTTNAFYQFVETSRYLGLISGYADNTFRPNNDITRGQAAKIVYQARQQAPDNTPTSTATPSETPVVVTATPSNTPVVVTATPSDTPVVITATPSNTPIVVTSTPTWTAIPSVTATPLRMR